MSQMNIVFDSDNFSKCLRQKRIIEDNIDLRSLADKIGTSSSTICRCENGWMPEIDTYAKLCFWLGRSMEDFLKVNTREAKKNKK